jgi:hypothetical protein
MKPRHTPFAAPALREDSNVHRAAPALSEQDRRTLRHDLAGLFDLDEQKTKGRDLLGVFRNPVGVPDCETGNDRYGRGGDLGKGGA